MLSEVGMPALLPRVGRSVSYDGLYNDVIKTKRRQYGPFEGIIL